jgi:Acetyltransferase (GNAT) domain
MPLKANDFYVPGLMDLSKYRLQRATADAAWDGFVDRAAEGTIFASSAFLNALPFTPGLWLCLKKNQIVGAVAVIEDGVDAVLAPHVIHGGIMFTPAPPEQNRAQVISEQFRITSAIVRHLTDTYRNIGFANAPGVIDLRPVQWHNYGADGPHFEIGLRYTSILPLAVGGENLETCPIYLGCNKSRRQEIRYGVEHGITVARSTGLAPFLDLYQQTFERQGLAVDAAEQTLLQSVAAGLLAADRLEIYEAREADGTLGSVVLIGRDAKRAYYLYGANNPALRSGYCGTMALYRAFTDLAARGVAEVDLEGINSPKRGYFKLSFGGDIRPYTRVSLTR